MNREISARAADEASAPFVQVSTQDGRPVVAGLQTAFFGHRIPRPDLPTDDGVFAAWRWHDGTLEIESDRYGMRPLFYATRGRDIVCSPSITAILSRGVQPVLDDAAIAVFLRLNFFIGDDTPFAAIRAVPPASRPTWSEGVLRFESQRPANPRPATIGRREAVSEFVDRFAAAVGRRLPSGEAVTLPITGGKDSRHILFALLRHGVRPSTCLTVRHYPPRCNDDENLARLITRELQLPLLVIDRETRRLAAERRKNILTEFCSDEHVQFLPVRDHLLRQPAVVYDGIAGDTLTQSWPMPRAMADVFERQDVDGAIQQLLQYEVHGLEQALDNLLTAPARRRFSYALATERLKTEVVRHMGGPNAGNAFVFWNRTRREVAWAPYGLLGFLPKVFAPFLDPDVFDFLMSLPVALVLDRQFQVEALSRAYPASVTVPFELQQDDAEDARYARSVATDLARMVALKPSSFVRRRYVLPRAAAAWLKGRVAPVWFMPLIVWLQQVSAVSDGRDPI